MSLLAKWAESRLEDDTPQLLSVCAIDKSLYAHWLLNVHYARRIPCVQHAFGLFNYAELLGVVTYGPPASPQVRRSVIGDAQENLLELNRLVIAKRAKANAASTLVGRSIRLLPDRSVVVSYADGKMGHVGYIYQATNFQYAGAATAHDSEYIIDGKPTHPRTLAARGISDPKRWALEHGVQMVPPKAKHRYVYLTGSKRDRKALAAAVKWPLTTKYPKGDSQRYETLE